MASKQHERARTGFGSECKLSHALSSPHHAWWLFIISNSMRPYLSQQGFDSVISAKISFLFWLDDIRNTQEGLGTCGWILVALSYVMCVLTFPFSLCVTVKVSRTLRTGSSRSGDAFRWYKNMSEQWSCAWVVFFLVRKEESMGRTNLRQDFMQVVPKVLASSLFYLVSIPSSKLIYARVSSKRTA